MLFLPQSVQAARQKILKDLDAGRIVESAAFEKLLALDPVDLAVLEEQAIGARDAGDSATTEKLLRQILTAHPWYWAAYRELSKVPQLADFSNAYLELAFANLLLDEEAMEDMGESPELPEIEALPGFHAEMSLVERLEFAAAALQEHRNTETAEVTAALQPYRLIWELRDALDVTPELVDSILAAGPEMDLLLTGILRGWARELMPSDTGGLIENTLALVGERCLASSAPDVLEFITLTDADASGAAGWALDKILLKHPAEGLAALLPTVAAAGTGERMALAERSLRLAGFDPAGDLIAELTKGLDKLPKNELSDVVPVLIGATLIKRGKAGMERATSILRRYERKMTQAAREECEDILDAAASSGDLSAEPQEPGEPISVYDICAGKVVWEDDGEEEEEEDEE